MTNPQHVIFSQKMHHWLVVLLLVNITGSTGGAKWKTKFRVLAAAVGQEVTMRCSLESGSNFTGFYRQSTGEKVLNSSKTIINQRYDRITLKFVGVVENDFGTYFCNNTSGSGNTVFQLQESLIKNERPAVVATTSPVATTTLPPVGDVEDSTNEDDGAVTSGRCESISQAVCVILANSRGKKLNVISRPDKPRGCYLNSYENRLYFNNVDSGAKCSSLRRCYCGREDIVTSGTCQSLSKAECRLKALQVPELHKDLNVKHETDAPSGCYYSVWGLMFYNTNANSSTNCSRSNICYCKKKKRDIRFTKPIFSTVGIGAYQYIQGVVEILHEGLWGTICNEHFNDKAATVICRMQGYGQGYDQGSYFRSDHQRNASSTSEIWLNGASCTGRELDIDQCQHKGWGVHNCSKRGSVFIKCYIGERVHQEKYTHLGCYGDGSPRAIQGQISAIRPQRKTIRRCYRKALKEGNKIFAVQDNNKCFTHPEAEQTYNKYGRQTGCQHGQGGQMRNDVYKLLLPATYKCYRWTSHDLTAMRINRVNEASYCEDFLGYMNNPGKSSIISPNCLGCSCCIRSFNRRKVPPTPSTVPPPTTTPKSTHTPIQGNGIRFPSPKYGFDYTGRSYIQGHVEVFHLNKWGTICDDGFNDNSATVLCKMLNSSKFISGKYSPAYKQNYIDKPKQIWLDDVVCNGQESHIGKCTHNGWSKHNCGHDEDVGIRCIVNPIRFSKPIEGTISGRPYIQGHLEILHNGEWGTICNDGMNDAVATVVCKMGGYLHGGEYRYEYKQPLSNKASRIWLDDLKCSGLEDDVRLCEHSGWGTHNCSADDDVGIRCFLGATPTSTTTTPPPQPSGRVRLVDTREGSSWDGGQFIRGYVQVWYHGRWGTICDDGLTTGDRGKNLAMVLCSMAGYQNGDYIRSYSPNLADLGEHMWLDEVDCGGWETDINQCSHSTWGHHDCSQRESVAIQCYTGETVTKASKVSSFNLNACIGGVIGAVALLSFVYGCRKHCRSKPSEDPRTVELTAVNGSEDQSTNNGVTPTTLEPEVELEPDDYETPIDSTFTEISDGPPRYRALFPPGYVPVKSEDELPPPPSYDESLRTSTENL